MSVAAPEIGRSRLAPNANAGRKGKLSKLLGDNTSAVLTYCWNPYAGPYPFAEQVARNLKEDVGDVE